MSEKFDFSKFEDQQKFEQLPQEEKEEVIDVAQNEAIKINYKIDSGDAKNYKTAERIIRKEEVVSKEIEEILLDADVIGMSNIRDAYKCWKSHHKDKISPEKVREAAKNAMSYWLSESGWDNRIFATAVKIKDQFELSESDMKEVIGTAIKKAFLTAGELVEEIQDESADIDNNDFFNHPYKQLKKTIKIIREKFNIDDSQLLDADIQNIARETISKIFYKSNWIMERRDVYNAILNINSILPFSEKTLNHIFKEIFGDIVVHGILPEQFLKYSEKFSLSDNNVKEIIKDEIIGFLSADGPHDSISESISDYLEVFNGHGVLIEFSQEDIKQIVTRNKDLCNLIDNVHEYCPSFNCTSIKTSEFLFFLIKFETKPDELVELLRSNPFLVETINVNPRFGPKLLIKYSEFDESSIENIETLFDIKKEILAQNPADAKAMAGKPDIDPESLEFRQLMQEKLKDYKNNPEILEAIKESGVNVDEWLNYSETQYFNLESGNEHLAFSETISAPINRIKETLDSYAHTLKETLKEYKPELSEFKIPLEDSRETEAKISKMQEELEKAKTEGNEKKAQGIEKGIESLKKKSENIKTVTLWDKLLGDISAFQQLKNDVFAAQERLMQAEKDLQEKLSDKMPSGKMIQEFKEKINKAKEELRSKFGVLERRIEDFKTNLPELIAPCLNQKRADTLIEEIEQNLAEQFDHWNTDRSTLANFFSERGDKEKGKLESQPMSIFVWARNPDIDLYQGNYSPCCICIDSAHMGAESTIADYNTDLGVQIINIYDETKNEPVTAAWCWIGKSETGEAVLVVDNIESNTMYSANYSEQLTKELFDYLENYAKSIGVKKIVLGKANNDLPTSGVLSKMKDDESKYDKLGGYNRDDGYFLEAEDKSVKLLWEKSASVETKERKEKKIKLIEFKNFSIESLAEKDLAKIKQLERKIYAGTDLISGQAMIENIKQSNGLEYSIVINGKKDGESNEEIIGYIAATEGETDEGDASVYLEDIAVIPEAQGQGIGWEMLKGFIEKLKIKAQKENKPVLLDMHLRENSQRFMERHSTDLEQMGVKLIEEALVADYYDEGEDALYQAYEVSVD